MNIHRLSRAVHGVVQKAETQEKRILEDALRAFKEITDVPATIERVGLGPSADADAIIELGGERLLVEIKNQVTPAVLGPILVWFARQEGPALLVARYISPPMAERLKTSGVPFLDTAGNAYVQTRERFYYITGRKPAAFSPGERPSRAFKATGLRIIFALLCVPDLAAASYRAIADKVGVALGSVNIVLKELEHLGFLQIDKGGRQRSLRQRVRLLDAWVEAYPRELRPRLKPRRFHVDRLDWWREQDLAELDLWLGGEPAAALLTSYLRPGMVTLYGDVGFKELAKRIRPVKDEYGNLELLERFWNFDVDQPIPGYRITPPLLVYADLVHTADARNLETAAMIKERYLA